jgi:hypothetical protein
MFDQRVFDEMYGHGASFSVIQMSSRLRNGVAAPKNQSSGRAGVSEALSPIRAEKSRLGERRE